MDTIYERQQARKRAEVWYGPWDQTRDAIVAARGARECADVGEQEAGRERDAKIYAGLQNMTPEQQAQYAFDTINGGSNSLGQIFTRLLFGEPATSDPTLVDRLYGDKYNL